MHGSQCSLSNCSLDGGSLCPSFSKLLVPCFPTNLNTATSKREMRMMPVENTIVLYREMIDHYDYVPVPMTITMAGITATVMLWNDR